MPVKYSDEELLENIRLVANDLGHTPTRDEYNAHSLRICDAAAIRRHFGGFRIAIKKAGLVQRKYGSKCYTKEDIVERIVLLIQKLDKLPSLDEIWSDPDYGVDKKTIYQYFGSLPNLFQQLGYSKETIVQYHRHRNISDEELLSVLYSAAINNPTINNLWQLMRLTIYSPWTYLHRFKSVKNINNALQIKYGIKMIKQKMNYSWIISELLYVADKLGKTPSHLEFIQHCRYKNFRDAIHHYGSYNKLVKAAGLKINKTYAIEPNVTQDKIIKSIQLLAKKIKHTPAYYEYDKYKNRVCSSQKIQRQFGSWNNALRKAGLKPQRMRYYTKAELIEGIKAAANYFHKVPTILEYNSYPDKIGNNSTIACHFGSWNNALKEAGFKPYEIAITPNCTKEDIIANIQQIAADIGHTPNEEEYNKNKKRVCCIAYIRKHFNSYPEAIKAAGLYLENRHFYQEIAINSLKECAKELGHTPCKREYNQSKARKYHAETIVHQFGSWNKALQAAGFSTREILTEEEMLENLKNAVTYYKRSPSSIEYDKYPDRICSYSNFTQRFGSYEKALSLIGAEPCIKHYTKEEIIANIQEVAKNCSEKISSRTFEKHPLHLFSLKVVYNRFGSWPKALEAAGLKKKSAS